MNTSSSLLSSSSRARCEQQRLSAQGGSLHTPTTDHRPHSADHRFAIARASRAARRCLHSGLRHTLQLVHRHFEHPNCIPRAPGCALARALACALGCALACALTRALPRALAAGRAAGAAAAAAAGSGGGAGRAGAPAPSAGWGSALLLEVDESEPTISSSPLTGGGRARASAPGTRGITSRRRSPHTARGSTRFLFLARPPPMRTGGASA